MNPTGQIADHVAFLEERIGYLEEANHTYVAVLDMLASSEEFHAELNRGKNTESIFNATINQLKRLLPFNRVGFLESEVDSGFSLVLSNPSECRDELLADIERLIMDGTFSWALNRNQPVIVPASEERECLLLHVIATKSRIRGMFIGSLPGSLKVIDSPSLNAVTITLRTAAHALESCTLYAMLRGHLENLERTVRTRTVELEKKAVELKISNEKLISLSNTDALTGLFNRRFLMAELQNRISHAKKNEQSLSLIIMDIDHFKNINDTHGHHNGDLVITAVAETTKHLMRSEDIVARYGGEEFVIVLAETSLSQAVLIAERLREAIHSICLPPPMEHVVVAASLGVATLPAHVDNCDTLVRQADDALYRAKELGRNRVETADSL